jgi:delta8-fatty-acid desaturase
VLEKMSAFSQGPVQLSEDGWVPLLPPICTGWIRKLSPDGSPHWHNEAIPDHSEDGPSSQILLVKKSDAPLASGPSLASIQPPPTTLSLKTQSQHSAAYKELHRRVVAAGLYRTRYISGYGPEVARYILLSLSSYLLYQRHLYFFSAIFLGALWHQLVFICHDLGHVGVTHSWHRDRLIAIFLTDFIGGISIGWWVHVCPFWRISHLLSTHLDEFSRITTSIMVRFSRCAIPSGSKIVFYSRHQPSLSVCYAVALSAFISSPLFSDPDIQHLPFFAITPAFFKSLYSSYYKRELTFDRFSQAVITAQHRLFYVIMSLARFNLYRLSYRHLWITRNDPSKARGGHWAWWLEVFALVGFLFWYGRVLVGCGSWQTGLMYLLVSNMVPSPLHVQVALSRHFR